MSAAGEDDVARFKRQAAERAVESIQPGMGVGLGSGSTAAPRANHAGGIVGHGLFLGLTSERVVAGPSGVEHRRPA